MAGGDHGDEGGGGGLGVGPELQHRHVVVGEEEELAAAAHQHAALAVPAGAGVELAPGLLGPGAPGERRPGGGDGQLAAVVHLPHPRLAGGGHRVEPGGGGAGGDPAPVGGGEHHHARAGVRGEHGPRHHLQGEGGQGDRRSDGQVGRASP